MVTREEAIKAAGEVLAEGYRQMAQMTVEEQARAAYTPTGPSIPELEARIRAERAEVGMPEDPSRPAVVLPPISRVHGSYPIAYDLPGAAAAVLVSESKLRREIRAGRLRARLVDRRLRIGHEDLQAWFDGLPLAE